MERLGQELLDFSRTIYDLFIVFIQFFHTHDRNDILQLVITLQRFLYAAGNFIMLFAHDFRFQNTGSGIQRIHRRIKTLFGDLSGEYRLRVQMGEGGGRSRVRQVVGRHVYSLN